jgi:hypothetical protein
LILKNTDIPNNTDNANNAQNGYYSDDEIVVSETDFILNYK